MKSSNRTSESLPATASVQPVKNPLERLREWQGMAEGAYSAKTLRAQKADGAIFQAFCEGRGDSFLPAGPATIRAFIEHQVQAGKKPATVRRYVATIGRAHIGAGLLNPCSGEAVRLALKKVGRDTSARQAQARALGWDEMHPDLRLGEEHQPRDQAVHSERRQWAAGGSRARDSVRSVRNHGAPKRTGGARGKGRRVLAERDGAGSDP